MSRLACAVLLSSCMATSQAAPFGLGDVPSAASVAARDDAIGPRGDELPAGHGDAVAGALVYAQQCAACHGAHGHEGPDPVLVGGQGSLTGEHPLVTVGSYWPYATTVFDYIRRAMPFTAPGSLSTDETYAVTAFVLHANGIIGQHDVMDRERLPRVHMPNRDGFIADPRPAGL